MVNTIVKNKFTYSSGVVIIGSLFWDKNHGRKAWREFEFGEDMIKNSRSVKVPIRYGRFSKDRKCPTMIFSKDFYDQDKLGTGIFLKFRKQKSIDDILCSGHNLSESEGERSRTFIKGGSKIKWCVITCWFNPRLEENDDKYKEFKNSWVRKYDMDLSLLSDEFKCNCENSPVFDNTGELKFNWPKELDDIDLILATQPKPTDCFSHETLVDYFFKKPQYFVKNRLSGITTNDDDQVIQRIKKKNIDEFFENAVQNGCVEAEINEFITNEFDKRYLL